MTRQFEWMKAVSEEEAKQSLATWKAWVRNVDKRKDYERESTQYFKYRNGPNAMIYPLEPIGDKVSLLGYCENLRIKKTFCYKDYNGGRNSYRILDYCLNEDTGVLSVATENYSAVKSLYLTSVTLNGNEFSYGVKSFFSMEGLEKYMTLARGEEWTGGDVFDDYC